MGKKQQQRLNIEQNFAITIKFVLRKANEVMKSTD